MSPVMLGAMGKAQRTGSKIPLRDRELKLTGVPSRPDPSPGRPPYLFVSLTPPPGSEHHSFLIPRAQGPGPRAVPLQPLPALVSHGPPWARPSPGQE